MEITSDDDKYLSNGLGGWDWNEWKSGLCGERMTRMWSKRQEAWRMHQTHETSCFLGEKSARGRIR